MRREKKTFAGQDKRKTRLLVFVSRNTLATKFYP